MTQISVQAVCNACGGTGLYIGMAERDGVAVVCSTCNGSGAMTVRYTPFKRQLPAPASVTSVHVARGYVLGDKHPACDGGLPIEQWKQGVIVPADEKLYCPYLYTHQDWCAHPRDPENNHNNAPMLWGRIDECPYWIEKDECWKRFHADPKAPEQTR